MSVEELELVISRLEPDELALFSEWFDEFRAQLWDRQIDTDIQSGKLDAAGRRADEDFEAGRCEPL